MCTKHQLYNTVNVDISGRSGLIDISSIIIEPVDIERKWYMQEYSSTLVPILNSDKHMSVIILLILMIWIILMRLKLFAQTNCMEFKAIRRFFTGRTVRVAFK